MQSGMKLSRALRVLGAVGAAAGAIACGGVAHAQTNATWLNPVNGNWSGAANWNIGQVPNNAGPNTFNAFINLAGNPIYTVTLDIPVTIQNFTISATSPTAPGVDPNTRLDLTSRTLNLNVNLNADNALIVGDNVSGTLNVNGSANVSGGTVIRRTTFRTFNALNLTTDDDDIDICDTDVDHQGTGLFAGAFNLGLDRGALFTIQNGASFNFGATGDVDWNGNGARPSFVNNGTLTKNAATGVTAIRDPNFTNNGTLSVRAGGEVNVTGTSTFTNFAAATLTGGTYDVQGVLRFNGANISTLNANLTLDGPGAFIFDQVGNDGLLNLATIAPGGALTIANGKNQITAGPVTNQGTLTLNGGSLSTGGIFANTGLLTGIGVVDAPLVSTTGTVSPGFSPGKIDIDGSLRVGGGEFLFELGGLVPGLQYDQVDVDGTITYVGPTIARVTLLGGFVPQFGDFFDIVTMESREGGAFAQFQFPTLPPGLQFVVQETQQFTRLRVIPAPASLVLAGVGAAAWLRRRRR
jgi:hypothetical protein